MPEHWEPGALSQAATDQSKPAPTSTALLLEWAPPSLPRSLHFFHLSNRKKWNKKKYQKSFSVWMIKIATMNHDFLSIFTNSHFLPRLKSEGHQGSTNSVWSLLLLCVSWLLSSNKADFGHCFHSIKEHWREGTILPYAYAFCVCVCVCATGFEFRPLCLLGWQALYHLNHVPAFFCFTCFSDRVLHFWPE
jgi:hypothetical protein